ncbi:MAG: PaaI family thioesterase [Planctomycetota bacterium]|nr:MAG: PaaI family thioesterase [Planctomycetota bacterium]
MNDQDHYRALEAAYASGPINDFYRPKLQVGEGTAEISMEVDSRMFHAAHSVHGSVYFKMLDDAAWFAAASKVKDVFILTSQFHIHLLRPVTQGLIVAKGKLLHQSLRMFVAEAVLYDQRQREIARGSGSFMRSAVRLSEKVGYRFPERG